MRPTSWRPIVGYAIAGLAVALLIASDNQTSGNAAPGSVWLPAVMLGSAVAISRIRSSWGLALLVAAAVTRIAVGVEAANDVLALAIVTFNCGRRGGRATIWCAGGFILLAYLSGGLYAVSSGTQIADALTDQGASFVSAFVLSVVGTITPLCVPMLLGITLRTRARAQHNRLMQLQAESERNMSDALRVVAENVARAESEKSALARDVHDVVGHSLAVILAQAESGLFLRDDKPEAVPQVLRTIADTARSSLEDVRGVLQPNRAVGRSTDLDDLVATLPATIQVEDNRLGTPFPLTPALAIVARRTLQEMLTNALKHGTDGSISVTRDWTNGLTLKVSNATAPGERGKGLGLDGMRRRVEGVGGTFNVDDQGTMYAVEAFIPRTADFG